MTSPAKQFYIFDHVPTTTDQAIVVPYLSQSGFILGSNTGFDISDSVNVTGAKQCRVFKNAGASGGYRGFLFNSVVAGHDDVTVLTSSTAESTVAPIQGNVQGFYIKDVNGIYMYVSWNSESGVVNVAYNPSGTANDINETAYFNPTIEAVYRLEWKPTVFSIYVNNKLVLTKAWTAVAMSEMLMGTAWNNAMSFRFIAFGYTGMPTGKNLVLGTPTVDTGVRTGGTSTADALTKFDGATSYMTYGVGTGQQTKLPATAAVTGTVLGLKVMAAVSGVGGSPANGKLSITTPTGTSVLGATEKGVGYVPTTYTLSVDPATGTAFNAANFASGFSVGIQEGV